LPEFRFAMAVPIREEWENVGLLRDSVQRCFSAVFADVDGGHGRQLTVAEPRPPGRARGARGEDDRDGPFGVVGDDGRDLAACAQAREHVVGAYRRAHLDDVHPGEFDRGHDLADGAEDLAGQHPARLRRADRGHDGRIHSIAINRDVHRVAQRGDHPVHPVGVLPHVEVVEDPRRQRRRRASRRR